MSKQIKLKNMLNENTPGYKDRKFGAPLPTLEDVRKAYENKEECCEEITEANSDTYTWEQINNAFMAQNTSPKRILKFLTILKKQK